MKKLLLVVFVLIFTCCETSESVSENLDKQQTADNQGDASLTKFNEFISTVKLPDELTFCGEKVPLDIPEVRERAEREFYLMLQKPGQMMLYIKRAGRYFPMYDRITEELGMPSDLKYVSVAESALYMARSSKGAVGLWQFIPSTGKKMGLIIDKYVDERRHPEKSTYAAMKYLKSGYDEFKSWFLAAAGYNMGPHRVTSGLGYQNADDYFDLFMNEETSRYILRIVITKELMENAEKYGFLVKEEEKYKQEEMKIVECSTVIKNLSEWAQAKGYTYKDVRLNNLWILKRILKKPAPKKPWKIALPMNKTFE